MTDPRCHSEERIVPPSPLPYVSRRALRRVKDWMSPPIKCRYCSGSVELVSNDQIYNGRQYGDWPYAYLCRPCDAFVGLHPKTDLPLGTIADKQTREARKKAKHMWQDVSRINRRDRNQAYTWLAQKMGIEKKNCHFGHFDIEQCEAAYEICVQEQSK